MPATTAARTRRPHADDTRLGRSELRVDARPARTRPLIVGIGGTTRPVSSSERAVGMALAAAQAAGAETLLLGAAALDLPMYAPERPERGAVATEFVDAIRRADGLIVASPAYHGSLSGLVKNALDYVEDLRQDERPYLDGRAVGCIVCAAGSQATATTLTALRSIVHALRGWPTPFGACIDASTPVFAADGSVIDPAVAEKFTLVGRQVVAFATGRAAADARTQEDPCTTN